MLSLSEPNAGRTRSWLKTAPPNPALPLSASVTRLTMPGEFGMGLAQAKKTQKLRFGVHIRAMKSPKGAIAIERLDERRYAVTVDGIVRYVGTQEECQQRVAVLTQTKDRMDQDEALTRSVRQMR